MPKELLDEIIYKKKKKLNKKRGAPFKGQTLD